VPKTTNAMGNICKRIMIPRESEFQSKNSTFREAIQEVKKLIPRRISRPSVALRDVRPGFYGLGVGAGN